MFLRTFRLKNYRKFRYEALEFPEGVIGIIGPNGSGKSTILEAVGWALYGNVMARTDKHEVKSQNAGESDDCTVELEFDMSGHSYKIVRVIKGKSAVSNALLYVDGNDEPEAERDSGVNEYIEKLLGMDYVTFLKTVYARQKDLAALSTLRPEERKKVIRRMLNIDRIDLAVARIRGEKRDKEEYIKGVEISLVDMEVLKKEKTEIVGEQKKKAQRIMELTAISEATAKEASTLKKEKEAQDKKYKIFNDLNKQLAKCSEQQTSWKERHEAAQKDRKELEQKKKKLEEILPQEQEYTRIKSEKERQEALRLTYQTKVKLKESISEMKEDIKAREENLKKITEKLAPFQGAEKEADEIEETIKSEEKKRREVEKRSKQIHGDASVLESEIRDLSSKKDHISDLGPESECPTCFRKLGGNYEEIIKHLNGEIKTRREKLQVVKEEKSKIDGEYATLIKKIESLVEKKNQLNRKLVKKSELEQSLKGEQEEIKKANAKLSKEEAKFKEVMNVEFDERNYKKVVETFEKLSEVRDTILELRKETQRIPKLAEEIEAYKKAIVATDAALKTLQQTMEQLHFSEEDFEKVKQDYEKVNERLKKSQLELEKEKGQEKIVKQKLLTINKDIDRQEEYRTKIKEIQVELQYYQRLISLMEDFRLELTGRIRPLLESRASYLFNEVTDGRYPVIELDENYEISILDDNQLYGLKRFSGGEEDLANLCLRIAMSQVVAERSGVAEINFIALDEIFGSQDEKRKQNIINSLNRLSSQFRQILLITHIEDIKEMFPRVLRVEENFSTKESRVILE